jgi:6,7-dimethyl-8-ribityllumazine synthase
VARYDIAEGEYALDDARIGIVAARFNSAVVDRLLDGALATLHRHGIADERITVVRVPGAFEVPLASQCLSAKVDAVIALAAVIRGETPHFDYVAGECARGVAEVALAAGVPVIFGVLTTDDGEQAMARAGGARGNKGHEAAVAAMEMVTLLRRLRE